MLYFAVGAAVVLAIAIAVIRPGLARNTLQTWQRYKEAGFLLIGGLTTFYFLTTGVWYLIVLGAAGVALAIWAVWFGDPLDPVLGWAR